MTSKEQTKFQQRLKPFISLFPPMQQQKKGLL
jgi:hypothetical protein